MLLVFGAEAAVVRTTFLDLRLKIVGYRARLIEFQRIQIPGSVGGDQCLMPAMLRAVLSQIYSMVADKYLGVYQLLAFRTQASR